MTDSQDIKLLHSPDKLLLNFKRSRFISCLLIAAAAHVLIFTLFSLSYIRDQLDPEGAKSRQEAALALRQSEDASEGPNAIESALTPSSTSAVSSAAGTAETTAQAPAVEDPRTNAAVMKEITELPQSDEIPDAPDDLGISIKDTRLE